jgi:glutamyl-tRNA synthetase
MSKRFADVALAQYREKGYLPEAIVNFLALLGWHPREDKEIMSVATIVSEFSLDRIQPAGAVFNEEKLSWMNKEYLKFLSDIDIAALLVPFLKKANLEAPEDFMERFVASGRSRASTLREFVEQGQFFFSLPDYEPDMLVWKKATIDEIRPALNGANDALVAVPAEDFRRETLQRALSLSIDKWGRGTVLWPLRVALSGQASSPDPIEIMDVLGKNESLRRIAIAVKKLAL